MQLAHWFYKLPLRLRSIFRHRQVEMELDEELAYHLEMQIQVNLDQGMAESEARRAALRRFGGVMQRKAECRDARKLAALESCAEDVRYGLRRLLRSPLFSLAAVIILALGIGANTAIFSVMNRVFFPKFPYKNPDRIVMVWSQSQTRTWMDEMQVSLPDYLDWQRQNKSFEQLAAFTWTGSFNLSGDSQPERLRGSTITANLLPLLGVQPILGHNPNNAEELADTSAIISYSLWQRRFGGDGGILAKPITVNGVNYSVIAVLPQDFEFPLLGKLDLLLPLNIPGKEAGDRAMRPICVIGRLREGTNLRAAATEMNGLALNEARQYPETNKDWTVNLVKLSNESSAYIRQVLKVLLGAVGFVLLIACANIALLMLARASARQCEMMVRSALGATRFRLFRQLLTETVLLALAGGVLGLLLGGWLTRFFVAYNSYTPVNLDHISLDGRVLAFTFGVSILSGLLFGAVPAFQISGVDIAQFLGRAPTYASSGKKQTRLRNGLVTLEVAASFVLLVGAGLMISTVTRLLAVNPGFDPNHLLTFQVSLDQVRYKSSLSKTAFYDSLVSRIANLPGIQAVSAETNIPFGNTQTNYYAAYEGWPRPPLEEAPILSIHEVMPNYFGTMRIPLLNGRLFAATESSAIGVINRNLANQYWPAGDAIGKHVNLLAATMNRPIGLPASIEIVGIIDDIRQYGLDWGAAHKRVPALYVPYSLNPVSAMSLIVRASDLTSLPVNIRQVTAGLDSAAPLYYFNSMEELIGQSTAEKKFDTSLLAAFALLALLLSLTGLYALISCSVSQRKHEIGIRMALGAAPADIFRLIMRQGLTTTTLGIGLGVVGAFSLTRFLSSLLYEVRPTDPGTFIAVTITLTIVALIASYIPAYRAIRTNPATVLKDE